MCIGETCRQNKNILISCIKSICTCQLFRLSIFNLSMFEIINSNQPSPPLLTLFSLSSQQMTIFGMCKWPLQCECLFNVFARNGSRIQFKCKISFILISPTIVSLILLYVHITFLNVFYYSKPQSNNIKIASNIHFDNNVYLGFYCI